MTEPKAGRELDAEVAERVMGYEPSYTPIGFRPQWMMPSNNPDQKHREEYPHRYAAFEPSTNIADAWEVVETIRAEEMDFRLEAPSWAASARMQGGNWRASFDHHYAAAETAPLAICLAAIKAVGVASVFGSRYQARPMFTFDAERGEIK